MLAVADCVPVADLDDGDRRQHRRTVLGEPRALPPRASRRGGRKSWSNCEALLGSTVPLIASSGISRIPEPVPHPDRLGVRSSWMARRPQPVHRPRRRPISKARRRARAARSKARSASIRPRVDSQVTSGRWIAMRSPRARSCVTRRDDTGSLRRTGRAANRAPWPAEVSAQRWRSPLAHPCAQAP
jgi:hypothetical protein